MSDIEHKLNSGLLEEVVIVAQRELDLVSDMKENAVYVVILRCCDAILRANTHAQLGGAGRETGREPVEILRAHKPMSGNAPDQNRRPDSLNMNIRVSEFQSRIHSA